jgi:hypothetical protein
MILPTMYGGRAPCDFFIYSACDRDYFDQFARELINSIRINSPDHLHLHIFNPRQDQLEYCAAQPRVSVSYEYVAADLFNAAAAQWDRPVTDPVSQSQLQRTHSAMKKGHDINLHHRMQKTYYACARFVRLAELAGTASFMSMDVDALVRSAIPRLSCDHDFYLHKITGTKARILAGGMYVNAQGRSSEFLNHYAQQLQQNLAADKIYWGLDQDILDQIVPGYVSSNLPISMIDWDMRADSVIWTAKGTRKDLPQFMAEKKRYCV